MKKLNFEVEFKSDIVLPATSNTEGNIEQLDFIPGSNFLGIVASRYGEFENSFKVFHSGDVKFGDATILCGDKLTYKMPLSYFFDKSKEKTLYNHHQIEDFSKFEQLKQKRKGYITTDKELVYIDYNYSQKSAYDKKNRRSLEGSMFGYSAIKSATKWQFSIRYSNISDKDIELLKATIVGKKRLGKSKSAQYGLIEIKALGSDALASPKIEEKNKIILYANSRLALSDENGNPTYDLKYLFEDLKDENIEYPKCQIKTSTFTPYNSTMQTKTYERVCINRGSVIVLKGIGIDKIQTSVGAYRSEGFGELIINPSFLDWDGFALEEKDLSLQKSRTKAPLLKTHLAMFLQKRDRDKRIKLIRLRKVDRFVKKYKNLYKNIKNSQWGKIRSICISGGEHFKEEIKEYISTGSKKWEKNQKDRLLDDKNSLECIKLISIQMPKKEQKDD